MMILWAAQAFLQLIAMAKILRTILMMIQVKVRMMILIPLTSPMIMLITAREVFSS